MNVVGGVLVILGAVFLLIGAVGVVRFTSPMERLHAASKGPTLGLLLIGTGTAVLIGTTAAATGVALVILLQLLAVPLGSHMIGRAIHREDDRPARRRATRG